MKHLSSSQVIFIIYAIAVIGFVAYNIL